MHVQLPTHPPCLARPPALPPARRQKPTNIPEFNRSAAELCGAANNSEGYGNPRAWGWASAGCSTTQTFMCKMQGSLAVRYTSPVTKSTYVWNTGMSSFDEAEETCNSYGGHLVAYNNAEEQQEVEVGSGAQPGTAAACYTCPPGRPPRPALSLLTAAITSRLDPTRRATSLAPATCCPTTTASTGWATATAAALSAPGAPTSTGSTSPRASRTRTTTAGASSATAALVTACPTTCWSRSTW